MYLLRVLSLSQIFILNYGKKFQSPYYAVKSSLWLVSGNVKSTFSCGCLPIQLKKLFINIKPITLV